MTPCGHTAFMRTLLTAIVERDLSTGILVASVPGLPGAHTQGGTVQEARDNLEEVQRLLRENGSLRYESEFVATRDVRVP